MRKYGQYLSWIALMIAGIFAITGFYQWRISAAQGIGWRAVAPVLYNLPQSYWPGKIVVKSEFTARDPFSEAPVIAEKPQETVSSNLILLGTVTGPNPRAVMAEKANPTKTYIILPGETCLGEKVDMIGRGYVILWKGGHKLTVRSTP